MYLGKIEGTPMALRRLRSARVTRPEPEYCELGLWGLRIPYCSTNCRRPLLHKLKIVVILSCIDNREKKKKPNENFHFSLFFLFFSKKRFEVDDDLPTFERPFIGIRHSDAPLFSSSRLLAQLPHFGFSFITSGDSTCK